MKRKIVVISLLACAGAQAIYILVVSLFNMRSASPLLGFALVLLVLVSIKSVSRKKDEHGRTDLKKLGFISRISRYTVLSDVVNSAKGFINRNSDNSESKRRKLNRDKL